MTLTKNNKIMMSKNNQKTNTKTLKNDFRDVSRPRLKSREPHLCCMVLHVGMDGATTLERVAEGYRMPRPIGRHLDCPPKIYEIMLKCWDSEPHNRPTFSYLLTFFDDYATETEEHYRPPDDE